MRPPNRFRALGWMLVLVCCVQACAGRASPRGCASGELQLVAPGRLIAGVDLTNPPYAYTDPDTGKLAGFEVELLRALAGVMELKLNLVNRTAPALAPAMLARQVDVAAASFRDDGSLPADACASAPYLAADLAVVVKAASIAPKDPANLGGRTVGVLADGPAAKWAETHAVGAAMTRYHTTDDLFGSVRAGKVEIVIADRPLALHTVMTAADLRVAGTIRLGSHYVLAGAPETAIMAPVNTGLRTLRSNGTLASLKRHWFGPGI